MKDFITKLLYFILKLLIIVLPIILFISSYDNIDKDYSTNSNIVTLRNSSLYDSLDVLFIGNSYCYSSIQPAILQEYGIDSYNLGIASAGIEFYEIIIGDYLNHINNYPKEIFILLSPMTFSNKSDNYILYPYHRYLEKPLTNYNLLIKYHRFRDILPLYRRSCSKGIRNIFSPKSKMLTPNLPFRRGFVESELVVSQRIVKNDEYLYLPFLYESFNYARIKRLNYLANKIDELGIKVTYLEVPTNRLKDYFNDEFLKNYDDALSDLSKDHDILQINKTLFSASNYRNIDHMNTSGSIINTHQIGKYLQSSLKNSTNRLDRNE